MIRRIRKPTDLPWRAWIGAARRVFDALRSNRVTDWAATLTYYSVLSLFPGLLVLAAALGLLGDGTMDALIANVQDVGTAGESGAAVDVLQQLRSTRTYSGPLAILGLITAVWTSSGYIGAFIRAANALYEVREGRPAWKTLPLRVGLTLMVVVVVAVSTLGSVISGDVAERVGRWLGADDATVMMWNIAKWPAMMVLVSLVCALLYWAAPNVRQPGFRWLTPGSIAAVLIWVAASAGFTVYASRFGSFNKIYGSLAGVVVFLVWLWLTNLAVLFGAAFDAELARARSIETGQGADQHPFLPVRDAPDDSPAE